MTVAIIDGICFGGGVGLTIFNKLRIVTDRTKWSMPEVNIGFFPDCRASVFLHKLVGAKKLAVFLALTGFVLSAEDIVYCGAADVIVNYGDLKEVEQFVDLKYNTEDFFESLKYKYSIYNSDKVKLKKLQPYIDSYFEGSFTDILKKIESSEAKPNSDERTFVIMVKEKMKNACLKSMQITHFLMTEKTGMSIEIASELDLRLIRKLITEKEFEIGVKKVLYKDSRLNFVDQVLLEKEELLKYFEN